MEATKGHEDGVRAAGISRRRMLQGAVAGGTLVWAAPVVDSFTSLGAATSPVTYPNAPFSYVAIQLSCETQSGGTVIYDVKYNSPNFNYTNGGQCGDLTLPCGGGAFDTAFPAPTTTSCPSDSQLSQQATFNSTQTKLSVVIGENCSITSYLIHNGTCCCGTANSGEPVCQTSDGEPALGTLVGTSGGYKATFNAIPNKPDKNTGAC
jgi:hypothetical protein